MSNLSLYTIIVAGGNSARFGSDKMLALLGDLPVFLHSVRAFLPVSQRLVLVVPPGREHEFSSQTKAYGLWDTKLSIVAGGDTRSDSVRKGLQALANVPDGIVAIHDGARPLATADLLLSLAELADRTGGAAPGKPAVNTLLRTDEQNLMLDALPRENLWEIETPQVFRLEELRNAVTHLQGQNFTDDTQLFARHGGQVCVLHYPLPNPKLTFRHDLDYAEFLLSSQRSATSNA